MVRCHSRPATGHLCKGCLIKKISMVGCKYFCVDECKYNSNICAILQLHNTTFCSLETSRNLFHFQIKNFFSGYNSADCVNKTKPKRWYEICNCLPKRIIIIDLLYMLPTFDTGVGNLGMTIILLPSNLFTTNNSGCHPLVLINQIRIFQLFLNEGEPPLTSPDSSRGLHASQYRMMILSL